MAKYKDLGLAVREMFAEDIADEDYYVVPCNEFMVVINPASGSGVVVDRLSWHWGYNLPAIIRKIKKRLGAPYEMQVGGLPHKLSIEGKIFHD